MNIYDIARMAGVSIATVSRVVNGSDKVSEKTKQRVLSVIEEAGYTPNVFAQGLGLNTMHTVGIMVPRIDDMYMAAAVSYLEQNLHRNGYECILSCSGFELERKQSHASMLLSKRIDALILVGSTYAGNGASSQQTDYIRAAAREVPVFVINGLVEGENVYASISDDRKATFAVTKSLIERGRKRILFLTDSQSYSAQQAGSTTSGIFSWSTRRSSTTASWRPRTLWPQVPSSMPLPRACRCRGTSASSGTTTRWWQWPQNPNSPPWTGGSRSSATTPASIC